MIALHEIIRQYPSALQKPEFYDQMVKEYFHHHMLQSLFNNKSGDKISFLGGTALRYFYDLKRFSEDLDFDCHNLTRDGFIELTSRVEKDLQSLGVDLFIEDKQKYLNLNAFRRVYVFPELKYKLGLSQQKETKFFIKIEAEPHHFNYQSEIKTINRFGISSPVKVVPLDIMFSSKIAACVKRGKDRDFFDIASLIDFAIPNFEYLGSKCNIHHSSDLKQALLRASTNRKTDIRKVYDCEHMLFNRGDIKRVKTFTEYIRNFDFTRFD